MDCEKLDMIEAATQGLAKTRQEVNRMNEWLEFEREKQKIYGMKLSYAETETEIKKLARKYNM